MTRNAECSGCGITAADMPLGMQGEGAYLSHCSGDCLSGYDIGIPVAGIAYPHPDCPAHGDSWVPYNNEWSRRYVADHPERFPHGIPINSPATEEAS